VIYVRHFLLITDDIIHITTRKSIRR